MKKDAGQRSLCRNIRLAPGLAVVVGYQDMTSFPHCHHQSVYGHAIQEKGASGKRRLDGELRLRWRGAFLREGSGRHAAGKRETSKRNEFSRRVHRN